MTTSESIPRMLQLLFGENAGLAYSGASEQMLRWARAFEDWLTHRQQNYHKSYHLRAKYAWNKALSYLKKPPWQITRKDVRKFRSYMERNHYAGATIRHYLNDIESFYDWCVENEPWFQNELNPSGNPFSNPVAGVKPKYKYINKVLALSAKEARALLATAQQDESILGKRDYAFFVCRLLLGVNLKHLLGLTWGQLAFEPEGVLVDWKQRRFKVQVLPPAAWEAIEDYLRHAGRLASMGMGDYIFAPLADALRRPANGEAGDWNPTKHVYHGQLSEMLKKYGRYAQIPEPKLTLRSLRYTAILLRQEAGDDPGKIQEFLLHSSIDATRVTLKRLGERDSSEPETQTAKDKSTSVPPNVEAHSIVPVSSLREGHRFQPWESMTHGLYAKRQPPEEVAAILAEGIVGLEHEIEGMRYVCLRLFQEQEQAESSEDRFQMVEAFTRAADRLGSLRNTRRQLAKLREKKNREDGGRDFLQEISEFLGVEPQVAREELLGFGGGGNLDEIIASLRLVLRRTFALLIETAAPEDLIRLADLYGQKCISLARLVKFEMMETGALRENFTQMVREALVEFAEERNLG